MEAFASLFSEDKLARDIKQTVYFVLIPISLVLIIFLLLWLSYQ